MLLRHLFEAHVQVADAAFCFGRFNPAHQGHIEVYKAVQAAGKQWFVGTNPSTHGPNDPLTFEQKAAWMQAIYPEIQGHILPEQSVVTLASKLYSMLGEGKSIAYVTDSKDWQWAGKLLNDYNGKEGAHGYYNFKKILHVESPRVSSATALRTAARAGDESAFYAASGTDPKLTVNGQTYFDTVVAAVGANPEKIKKVANKKEVAPVETIEKHGSGYRLVSKHGHKNLGTYPTKAGAEKRERQVQYFKHAGEDIAEAEKNPHTSALGKALHRDLSKEKKASPQQVQRNKERWAKRQAEREQGVAEGAPIVVMPSPERLKKAEPPKQRYMGDIVPPTKPPSTEKRGVKGRPGQRPMPDHSVAEGEKQSKSREMDLDWHYKNIINTKGLSDKAKKDTTDIYNNLKKKEQGVADEGISRRGILKGAGAAALGAMGGNVMAKGGGGGGRGGGGRASSSGRTTVGRGPQSASHVSHEPHSTFRPGAPFVPHGTAGSPRGDGSVANDADKAEYIKFLSSYADSIRAGKMTPEMRKWLNAHPDVIADLKRGKYGLTMGQLNADLVDLEQRKNHHLMSKEGLGEGNSKTMAHTAKSLENPPKIMQHRAKRDMERDQQLKGRDIAKRNESVDLKTSLKELSNDMLGKYKKAASADASRADKAGDYARGNKRFKGINTATMKQFDNDAKKSK